jgi:hypothetical protein
MAREELMFTVTRFQTTKIQGIPFLAFFNDPVFFRIFYKTLKLLGLIQPRAPGTEFKNWSDVIYGFETKKQ